MKRKNCWEFQKCGREPGGDKAEEFGVCPAAKTSPYDGTNKGKFSGRFCWFTAGTFCRGIKQGTFAQKLLNCIHCKFFKQVQEDESHSFVLTPSKGKKK